MQDIEIIKLSKSSIENSYINISKIIDFFPNECIGGTSKVDYAKHQITIHWDIDKSIKSDIASDKKIIRNRSWVKKFIVKFNLKENDLVAFEKTGAFIYKVYPLNRVNPVLCSSADDLAIHVKKLLSSIKTKIPIGQATPKKCNASTSNYIRDAAVVAYVLNSAQGRCECCEKKAPFFKNGGMPFLEVHHVQQLSQNGEDTINNAVAVCPNCHRELHLGEHRKNITKALYRKVERLKSKNKNT